MWGVHRMRAGVCVCAHGVIRCVCTCVGYTHTCKGPCAGVRVNRTEAPAASGPSGTQACPPAVLHLKHFGWHRPLLVLGLPSFPAEAPP